MYKKGIATKNLIYKISKDLFYQKGYTKTTIKDIVTQANVPLGLFTYYFKTKDTIAQEIYSEFLQKLELLFDEHKKSESTDSITHHAAICWLYYYTIFSDKNNQSFYYEVLSKESNNRTLSELKISAYKNYINDFNLEITPLAFESIMLADYGGRREFFINYQKKPSKMTIDELVFFVNGIAPRLFGMDQKTIDTCLLNGINIAKNIPHTNILFLGDSSIKTD